MHIVWLIQRRFPQRGGRLIDRDSDSDAGRELRRTAIGPAMPGRYQCAGDDRLAAVSTKHNGNSAL